MAPLNNCSTAPLLAKMTKEEIVSLEPVVKDFCPESSSDEVDTLDHNHNDVFAKPTEVQPPNPTKDEQNKPKRKRCQEINERTRKMVLSVFEKHLNTNLNILVIGQRGSGKTSLINSLCMALNKQWSDKARYCPGRNHVIDECVIHQNPTGGKVVFADTRGFEDIHDADHAVLILRYVMEGRIPAKCIPCVLLMSKELIKKRYHRAYDPKKKIDCVLYVSAIDEEPSARLMALIQKALATSKHSSVNRVPIVSVATKCDLLSDEDRSRIESSRGILRHSLEHSISSGNSSDFAPRRVSNYCCELEPFSDKSIDPSSVESSLEKDTQLLTIWREIIVKATSKDGKKKRVFSTPPSTQSQTLACLPFRFDYSRLRSGSF